MNITAPFVLRQDVLLVPCAKLSDDVRSRISHEEGDFTLSRRHGRSPAQVIDAGTAALLESFRQPCTIVEAVIANSRALDKDPEAWLDELLPHLGAFVQTRVLIEAGSEPEEELRPRYDSGTELGQWTVVRCASLIEDSEIYQLSDGTRVAALKIARVSTPHMQALFDNEAAVLRHLEGAGIAPRLLEAGVREERPYLISEWIPGVEAGVAAAQRRHDRASLIDLCVSIASRYAALHAHGVLHADVHPRNILVGDDVMLVDFGYSRGVVDEPRVGRAGLGYFYEPEYIAARRQDRSQPASAAGEQYALAALLYLLLTGHHYLEFRYEREEMGAQIENDPPLPFTSRGIPPWPDVEQILFRALEKEPARRHESIAAMTALLAEARDATFRESLATPVSAEANALLENTLRSFSRGGEMFAARYASAPKASITFGSAGAAVGLLRIAETRGDAALLALADVWRSRAMKLIGDEEAFYDPRHDLSREQLGDITPFHTEAGVHAAAAMIAAAMGDGGVQGRAITAFLEASRHPCAQLDLTLGRSGSLLAAAMLLSISDELPVATALRRFGAETMKAIWSELDTHSPLDASPPRTYLGIAHGWAGYLYAAMRWCAASGDAPPPQLLERLHQLAELKTLNGRGAQWRTTVDKPASMSGWCNGSAGHLFLYTLAHRMFADDQWLRLAELSAWNLWDAPRISSTLCCGTAGGAYALLSLYKHTGATEWLSRARHLANHAASSPGEEAPSLWKGSLGIAVLIADLASPENARMPFFEYLAPA